MSLLAVVEVGRGPVPPDEPVFHADDLGVLRGRAVFETLRVYDGAPFRLGEHLDRLASSAARVGLPAPDRAGLEAAARTVLDGDAVLRLLWSAGREGGGGACGFALLSTLPDGLDELRARGLRAAALAWSPGMLAGAKSTSYAENMVAQDEARRRGADDALLVGADGIVLEGPTSNVWWREGSRLLTPSLELPILAGVTRSALLELAPASGYEVDAGAYELKRLLEADEAFFSSSVREVMPLVRIDERQVGDGQAGPAAASLQRALRAAAGYPQHP
ncbi:MAG: aminotransferase class IV [Gaiellaceae bacterium]